MLFYHSNVCNNVPTTFDVSFTTVHIALTPFAFHQIMNFLHFCRYFDDRKENRVQKLNVFDISWSVVIFPILFR